MRSDLSPRADEEPTPEPSSAIHPVSSDDDIPPHLRNDPPPAAGGAPADVADAIHRLAAAGLVARVSRSAPLLVQGGVSQSTDAEIRTFQDPFMLSEERDGMILAVIAGPGNLSRRARTGTLREAVDVVLDVYRERGLPVRDDILPSR